MAENTDTTAQDQPKPGDGETPKTDAGAEAKPDAGAAGKEKKAEDTPKGDETKGEGADGKADPPANEPAIVNPEGSRLTDADLAQIAAEATAAGLTPEQRQKLVEARAEQLAQTADRFLAELKADPVLGGDKFEATVALAVKGRDLAFPPGTEEAAFINDLFEKGLGNHKLLIRAFARLGKMASEDNPVTPGKLSSGGQRKKAPEEVLYGE